MQKYTSVIENKKHDAKIIDKKKAAWAQFTCAFNSQGITTKCTVKQLQEIWKGLKKDARKEKGKFSHLFKEIGNKMDDNIPVEIGKISAIVLDITNQLKA